ncbi:protein kinase [Laetiporus sulphureus 93-53]|uniref:non-specific serine/threonine protein kinase n=1 Tax=Laetiporus sulphureus 93-53 TaxID=1314785 RepID=A0A165C6D6_9APHY|nr:protein kinase [Laetiporus sulphureus 93-53]KZT02281.1 protein kinase [Laetiporus sulphureus 93-53]
MMWRGRVTRNARPRRPSPPRLFPTSGFEVIDNSCLVEEETWEWYRPDEFYPVRIGEVLKSKYQVVGKLGYGGYATVWLCRDLAEHRHVTLKIGTCHGLSGELSVSNYLRTIKTSHIGSSLVREMLDEFEVTSHNQKYQAIVYSPLAITLRGFRKMLTTKSLPAELLKLVLKHIFLALDFLHTEARVIHTDIQEKNILLGLDDNSAKDDLKKFEKQEVEFPSPRKIDSDRIIHTSRPLVPRIYNYGRPVLCDLGEARFGKLNPMDDIQPYQYRAPEVILDIPWDEKVDIWNVGVLIWDLFENGNLFKTRGGAENKKDNIYHLAHMIALLGLPPKDFLERSQTDRPWQWFDRNGNWKGVADIPKTSLEDAEKNLAGEDKALFLHFVRKMLRWKPEERASARELLDDPWLNAVD